MEVVQDISALQNEQTVEDTSDLTSFEDYWLSTLEELGFRQNDYGEIVFGDADETVITDEEGNTQRLDHSLYRTVVSSMVDRVLQTYGEDVAKDKLLRDAVVAFLSSQPPQNLSEAGVRLVVLAGLGLKSLREREYQRLQREREVRKNPKSVLNPNFRSAAERLAEQMGLDPDELIQEYIQEWYAKQGVNANGKT